MPTDLSLPFRLRRAFRARAARWAARRPRRLPDSAARLVLTFDDVPMSAATTGAAILDRFGARATFFACGGIAADAPGAPFADGAALRALHAAGHEIGCHGFAHLDYGALPLPEVVEDLDRNAAFFARAGLPPATSFAYPYGRLRPAVKRACAARFALSRGVRAEPVAEVFDAALVPAMELSCHRPALDSVRAALRALAGKGGALVLFTHAVTESPGRYDTSPAVLTEILQTANAGGIVVDAMRSLVPVDGAVRRP